MAKEAPIPLDFMRDKTLTICFFLTLSIGLARTEVPDSYARLWNDPALLERMQRDTERHRKSDATVEVTEPGGKAIAGATLEIRQQTNEFLFGCNLFVLGQLTTPELNHKYEDAFAHLFNFATLPFYWRELEPEAGKPRFAADSGDIWRRPPPDRLLKWCQAHQITPKGHALLYAKNKFMPDWTTRNDPETFRREAAQHLSGIAGRYGGEIPVWDAINEEMPRRIHFREWHAVPDDYLVWCFQEASRLFPQDVKLLINDGQLQAHYDTGDYISLAKEVMQSGAHIGGIGMQFHVTRDSVLSGKLYAPAHLCDVYAALGRLGLPLYITEITVPGVGENGAELQAAIVENYYRLWFSTPMMAGITWWNLGDGTAYENENQVLGGLLDAEMNPKPAYRALERLIHEEWRTRLTLKTNAQGQVVFRGFHGDYEVSAESGGRTVKQSFRLTKNAPSPWKIRF
jgi:endo-1,4-beta-xylanase